MSYEDVWRRAIKLRMDAYDSDNPELYRMAAAEYRAIDRDASAEACDKRARHYERVNA